MNNARKALIGIFLSIFIIFTLAHTVLAQKNETIDILQQENKTTAVPNATYSEVSQKSELTKEEIITEAQRSFDRSLSILNIVAASMAVLVGLITIIVVIAIALGFFEYSKWKAIRKDIEKEANVIKELRNKAEKDANTLRNELEKIPPTPLTEKPSEETTEKLDEFSRRFELLEVLGVSLKPEDYIQRGNDLYYKGKYELAFKAFEKAIELKPDDAEAWSNKGAALGKLKRLEEALKAHEKAIELKPDYAVAWYNKGVALGELKRLEEALKAFEKAIELKPDYAVAWSNKGAVLGELKRLEEALKAHEKAIELKPDDAEAWSNKGVALGKLNRLEEALKAYEKAIELKPDYAKAWFNRACAYSLKGDKEEALSDLRKAIELDKSYKEKAKTDKDFEWLWDDKDFKNLVT
ncbi:MAG: tetratricopeptide repeat protein [Candidatus Methanoperedens sp.]|nr:tetratricopeptide repeat protein [Candidatus Methanoperedens sp.]MCZ7405846.1 tetratricopeptide repeat protein [Candidatus Methanoperedens sp.]